MTNNEAIKTLEANYPDACYEQLREAVDAAIEALKAQDAAGDTISRQAAIEALQEHRNLFCDNTPETFSKLSYAEKSRVDELDMAIATLINLPSAQPERETAKFIRWMECKKTDEYISYTPHCKCSKCGTEFLIETIKYCYMCGARMD